MQNQKTSMSNTRMLVEGGIMIAMAQALSYVKLFQMPYGGSVTLGSMVPIFIFALRWGTGKGVVVGALYGILQYMLGPKWSTHPIAIMLDYPIAYGCLGLAGLFSKKSKNFKNVFLGIFLGTFCRFISHVISGMIFFRSSFPEGMNPLVYSILYNGGFLSVDMAITLLISWFLMKYGNQLFSTHK
ncbi:MAG TPA: energy-coupled thiamine transporter ThiT [Clostridiales bacterium]|nr:energy-coupled thiamine transporter ThiT [Clostridiales bacterium]